MGVDPPQGPAEQDCDLPLEHHPVLGHEREHPAVIAG
jgi:hypothetical protein